MFTLSKYISKNGQWVTPEETSGSIQNTSSNVTIEVTTNAEDNQGLIIAPMQIVNFEGTIYVKSSSDRDASFTVVPFKVSAGGGGAIIKTKDIGSTKGTVPSSNRTLGMLMQANSPEPSGSAYRYGSLLTTVDTAGTVNTSMRAYKNEEGSIDYDEISVSVDSEGNVSTSAPTPAATSNDTNIATTQWVKNYTSGTCTNTSSVSGGNIRWYKNGRMATITLFNVKTSTTSSSNIQLTENAPKALTDMYMTAVTISGKSALVHVNATGSVVIYNNITTTEGFFGTVSYPTSEVTSEVTT